MNTLATQFRYDGYEFKQLARCFDVALFEKTKPGRKVREYEVVLIQQWEAEIIHGKLYPEREVMPPTSAWGSKAWSFLDLERAEVRFWLLATIRHVFGFAPKTYRTVELIGLLRQTS